MNYKYLQFSVRRTRIGLRPMSLKEKFLNPLTAKNEISIPENLTFLWTWILGWVPRSSATHTSLCNTLFSNKMSKKVKILVVKVLNHQIDHVWKLRLSFLGYFMVWRYLRCVDLELQNYWTEFEKAVLYSLFSKAHSSPSYCCAVLSFSRSHAFKL